MRGVLPVLDLSGLSDGGATGVGYPVTADVE